MFFFLRIHLGVHPEMYYHIDPRPRHLCHDRCVLWQDTLPTLSHVNVYVFDMEVGGGVGAEWQPRFHQSAPG